MTTKYFKTTGIELFKLNGDNYCRMIDVLKLIQHEILETDDKSVKDLLDRMQMRVTKNAFICPPKNEVEGTPRRYAVGRCKNDRYEFYVDSKNGEPFFTGKPCIAKLYMNYRDARACADFLDGDWDVLDWEANMTEEERWVRWLRIPYDADEGNENAIPVEIVT